MFLFEAAADPKTAGLGKATAKSVPQRPLTPQEVGNGTLRHGLT